MKRDAMQGRAEASAREGAARMGVRIARTALLLGLAGAWVADRPATAQPGAIKLTVSETKKEGPGKGEWTVTTTVKNTDTAAKTIVFWSWPAEPSGAKIGDLKWEPPGTVPKDPDATKPGHKEPKDSAPGVNPGVSIPAGGTVTHTEVRKKDPHSVYVRVFEKDATGGTWTQKNIVAHNIHLVAFQVKKTNPVAEWVAIPIRIPYPTDLPGLTDNQQADFFIKSVSLPAPWQTAFLGPALDERFPLLPTQREFTGMLVVKPMHAMAEGEQAIAQVTWGVELNGTILTYEFTIRALLISDSLPPSVTLTSQRRAEGTWVSITAQDPSGIHHGAHLEITRLGSRGRTSEIHFLPRTRVLAESPFSEIGATTAVFEAMIPNAADGEIVDLQASVQDQFGNSARSAGALPDFDAVPVSEVGSGKRKL